MSAWGRGWLSGDASGFAGAFRLARKEMRQAWPSYPLSSLFLLLSGFFVAPSLSGVFELRGFGDVGQRTEEFYNAFFSDCLFLVICAFLAVNVVPGGYARVRRGAFYAKLRFFRKLPVPAGSVVGSRALGMLFALILNAPAFYLPAFLISDLGELGASYLWFAGIWIGYCLLASGFYLHLELTEREVPSRRSRKDAARDRHRRRAGYALACGHRANRFARPAGLPADATPG